jgi:hypothetical protein
LDRLFAYIHYADYYGSHPEYVHILGNGDDFVSLSDLGKGYGHLFSFRDGSGSGYGYKFESTRTVHMITYELEDT